MRNTNRKNGAVVMSANTVRVSSGLKLWAEIPEVEQFRPESELWGYVVRKRRDRTEEVEDRSPRKSGSVNCAIILRLASDRQRSTERSRL
jgi:hypothetical protein